MDVCIEPFQDNVWDTITFMDLFGVIPGSIERKWRSEAVFLASST
jgi:hypothetical protein